MQKPDDILDALRRGGVIAAGEDPDCTPLTGGVSSDIWRIDLEAGPVCVKRALAKLKVADDWRAISAMFCETTGGAAVTTRKQKKRKLLYGGVSTGGGRAA